MSNIFSGCCHNEGQNGSALPGLISGRSSIRGITKGQPRYYGGRDRGAFTEVASWLGGVPTSVRSTWTPYTHSTWSRSGTGLSFHSMY